MKDEIIGHRKILQYFNKVIDNDNLSHSYCFVGPSQVGKHTVARMIAGKLLNTELGKLDTQPDFVEIKRGINEKTGKSMKDISIEQFRKYSSFFSSYAFLGGYKIVIVDPADKMSLAASNALLKTLEEPRQKTLFFLITDREEKLPQTIRSRCQMIYFFPVAKDEIQSMLDERGIDEAEEMARLACGLPGRALAWEEDGDSYQEYKTEVLRFGSLLGKPFYEKLKKLEELFGDKKDHVATRNKLKNILGIWQTIIRDLLLSSVGLKQYAVHKIDQKEELSKNNLLQIDYLIGQAKEDLDKNIHPRLLVEQILLSIP